jgi:hypothetical protein
MNIRKIQTDPNIAGSPGIAINVGTLPTALLV